MEDENVVINMPRDSSYYRLIVGILKTAVRDYLYAVKKGDFAMIEDCEKFFYSKWYDEMCNVPGVELVFRLRKYGKKIFDDVKGVHVRKNF